MDFAPIVEVLSIEGAVSVEDVTWNHFGKKGIHLGERKRNRRDACIAIDRLVIRVRN
jgi:hypothetical protein